MRVGRQSLLCGCCDESHLSELAAADPRKQDGMDRCTQPKAERTRTTPLDLDRKRIERVVNRGSTCREVIASVTARVAGRHPFFPVHPGTGWTRLQRTH